MGQPEKEFDQLFHANLAKRLGSDRYSLWCQKMGAIRVSDDAIHVECTSEFLQSWLRKNLHQELVATLHELGQSSRAVDYHVVKADVEAGQGGEPAIEVAGRSAGLAVASSPAHVLPFETGSRCQSRDVSSSSQQASSGGTPSRRASAESCSRRTRGEATKTKLPRHRLDGFVVGDCNRLAYVAASQAVQRPGEASPVLIYGPTGCGKTHLLQGIHGCALGGPAPKRSVLMTAEQFTAAFVEASHNRRMASFRSKYRGVDFFLLDGVQFLAGKSGTLGEFLYTIDTLMRLGRQVVVTADRPPKELYNLGNELVSRLLSGVTAEIEPMAFAVRRDIAKRSSATQGVSWPAEVFDAIARQVGGDGRLIQGAVNRMYLASVAGNQPMDLEGAETILGRMQREGLPKVRLKDIEQAVCEVFSLDTKCLNSPDRKRRVSQPRTLAMWMARKYTRAGLIEIGRHFGGRSHSTVVAASKKVDQWLSAQQALEGADEPMAIEEAIRKVEARIRRA